MNGSLLLNSLAVGLGATALAWFAGVGVAVATATARPRLRQLWLGLTVLNLALPPFLIANAWLDLTADWRSLAPASALSSGSLTLTALALASLLWPLTCLLILGAWNKLQREQLEADPMIRGGWLFRRLLLPAARAEAVAAAAITLVLALANFTIPTLFQVRVFTEEFWIRFNTQFDLRGAILATWPLLVVPLLLLIFLPRQTVAWPRRQVSLPPDLLRQQLGSLAIWARGLSGLWLVLTLGLPLGRLLLTQRTWTELASAVRAGHSAIWVSAWTAVGTASLVVLIGLLVGGREQILRATRWVWLLFLVPGVFLGVSLISLFNRPLLASVYQSLGIVFIALVLRYLAPGGSMVIATLRTADDSLADVARSLGAGRWRVWRDAILPQSWPGIAAAWYAVYLLCLWDVESVVLIQPPGGESLALRIFNLLHYGHAGQVNALCVVMLALAAGPGLVWALIRGINRARQYETMRTILRKSHGFSASLLLVALSISGCTPPDLGTSSRLDSKLFSRVEIIGSRGVAPGQFNKPRSVQCDRDDNVYVADLTGRIQKFSPDGRFLLQWQMPQTDLGKPKGMTVDREGQIVVVEPHYMRVNHFTPGGDLVAQWGIKGTNAGEFILPRAIAQNSHGEIYLSEYTVVDRVQRFSPEAKSHGLLTAASKVLPQAALLSTWGSPGTAPGEFNRAEGLGIGPNDNVLVADSCNHRIQVFSREGKFLRTYGQAGSNPGEFSYPYDVRVDSNGHQFVCEFGNSRITVLDPQDRVVEVIGGAGAAPGKFANPWAIALDSKGNLYVADSQNHRVQKLLRSKPLTPNHGLLTTDY